MIAMQSALKFATRAFSIFCLTICLKSSAQQLTRAQTDFFENKVRPILVSDCYKCHSKQSAKIKGGLLLDTSAGLLKGGDTGAAVVPGAPEKSLLIEAVNYTNQDLQMPPDKKLSDGEIADLISWVKMGAPDTRVVGTNQVNYIASRDHWSFKP